MSPGALESEIQDYLDGRMAEPRRRAFEARLAEDVDLARRVRALREIGAALAGGDEQLSPDFYARLRSRFEPSQAARVRRSRMHRFQALGLAAAALIALVLFVPQMLDERLPVAVEPSRRDAAVEPAPPPPAKVEQQRAAPETANEAPKEKEEKTKQDLRGRQADAESDEPESLERELEPAPSAIPQAAPQDSRLGAAQGEKDEMAGAGAEAPRAAARAEGFALAPPPSGLPVRPGLVERESVVEIDDRAGWEQLEVAALGRYDPARRVVLVGDRDGGLDCAAARLVPLEDAYEIRLVRQAAGIEQDGHACAFVLPRDGRAVRVVGPPSEAP